MSTEITTITKIAHDLLKLHHQRATGELIITCNHDVTSQWRLYFYLGRLVHATGGAHPVKRWLRAFRHHCGDCYKSGWLTTVKPESQIWDVDILNQAIQQGQITSTQAKAVVQSIVQEVVFSFVEQTTLEVEWQPGQPIAQQSVILSVEQVIQDARQLRDEWRSAELGYLQELMPHFTPDLALVIKHPGQLAAQVSPAIAAGLIRLARDQQTLWDLSLRLNRPLSKVMRSLLPLIRQGIVGLETVPDLPNPFPLPEPLEPLPLAKPLLVACIDDSPVIGETLEQILRPTGCDVLTILNPLQGIALLLERKPDIIFLDLVMPNTNGYELCTFLRKTSTFQHTPIVILTGHDGVIDRVRARMVGASEFLAKPPDAAKVMQVVQKYLKAPEVDPLPSPDRTTALSARI